MQGRNRSDPFPIICRRRGRELITDGHDGIKDDRLRSDRVSINRGVHGCDLIKFPPGGGGLLLDACSLPSHFSCCTGMPFGTCS